MAERVGAGRRRRRTNDEGLNIELPDDQFERQHNTLVAAGYAPRGAKHPVLASRTMYVDDPDGNQLEFICRAPAQ